MIFEMNNSGTSQAAEYKSIQTTVNATQSPTTTNSLVISELSKIIYCQIFHVAHNGTYPTIVNVIYSGEDTSNIWVSGNTVYFKHGASGLSGSITATVFAFGEV